MRDCDSNSSGEFTAGDNFFGQMIEAGVADDQFIREIVEMFLTEGNQSLSVLRQAFDAGSEGQVKLYAHKLKSSFLMFDMHEAHQLALKLEYADITVNTNDVEKLEEICKNTFALLRQKYLK